MWCRARQLDMSQRYRMPTADVAWLHMDRPTNLMVNNVVLWFDAPVDWDRVKEICRDRLVGRFPRFSGRVAESRVPLRPVGWEDDPRFDLEHHFHHLALPAPGDHAALLELVADLMATPLDHDKPLWDMYLVEGYGRGCAIVSRTHHCIADGIALSRAILSLTDDAADGAVVPAPPARARDDVVRDGHSEAARRTAAQPPRSAVDTPLRGELGVVQRVASTDPISLADVRRTGHATGTTVNDVMLSAVTGALRSYLVERVRPAAEFGAFVPFNIRPLSEPLRSDLGNKFGPVFVSLPVGLRDRRERLAEVHRRMAGLKDSPGAARSFDLLRVIGAAPPDLARVITDVTTAKASALITDVTGPPNAVSLAGAPVRGMLVWAPRPGSTPMSVTIFSYNGQIIVGLAGDAGLMPDPERILARVEEELVQLQELAGNSAQHHSAAA
jgi:diacylglycerol O-acyltransferase